MLDTPFFPRLVVSLMAPGVVPTQGPPPGSRDLEALPGRVDKNKLLIAEFGGAQLAEIGGC